MKELLWTCSSQLIFYLNTSIQVCVSQLFSRMCRRQVISQPCYLHLHLCPSLCFSHFPPSQSKIFFSHLCLFLKEKKKFQLVYLYPLWNQHWALLITTSPRRPYGAGCRFQDAICFPLGRRLRQKGRWLPDCSNVCFLQCCKCLNGSTQTAHTKDYLYLQAPVLAI